MCEQTYGLIGKSLSHSFSKDYFTEKFASLNLPHKYLNFELDSIHDLKDLVKKRVKEMVLLDLFIIVLSIII